ncbi:hypothetical protein LCGC14_1402520 [marine sediment metagenome]|uniref:Phage protein n=1 Tax=marine sediment metagenome TaxID=412755 RepID=A0A0F9MC30_9ZZZZ
MKIEIDYIKNGWIVKHDVTDGIWDDQVFFKTINQASAYAKKILEKYRSWQDG